MLTPSALRARYRTQRWFRNTVDLAGAALLVTAVGAYQTRDHPRGAPPPMSLRTLDGAQTTLDRWRGHTTVVEFWAPWCTVCRAQTDNLARAQRWLGGRARVLSVAAAYERVDDVRRSPLAQGHDVPVLLTDDPTTRRLRVQAYPTIFVIDAGGHIVTSMQGYTTTLGLVARALWY